MVDEKENSDPHFVKIIQYNKESWITDVIFGQKGNNFHGHISLSGSAFLYVRDGEGKEIIKNGCVVSDNTSI